MVLVCRQQSDIARLEAKVERLDAQLQHKDREIATITRTVSLVKFQLIWLPFFSCVDSWLILVGQEAKNTAALKSQIEKLQQERDEFQRMVIGNQVWLVSDAACFNYFFLVKLYWWVVYIYFFDIWIASQSSTDPWNEEKGKGLH